MTSLGIVGYRSYDNYQEFCNIIDNWIQNNSNINQIISGGATGVDSLAEKYAKEHDIPFVVYPADWKKYGNKAGPLRNQLIIDASTHLLALPSRKSRGTFDSINKAKQKGIPVTIKYID